MARLLRRKSVLVLGLQEFDQLRHFFLEGVEVVEELRIVLYEVDPAADLVLGGVAERLVLLVALGPARGAHVGEDDGVVEGAPEELVGQASWHACGAVDEEGGERVLARGGHFLDVGHSGGAEEQEALARVDHAHFVVADVRVDQRRGALHDAELRGDRPERDRAGGDVAAANHAERPDVDVRVLAMRVDVLDGQTPTLLPRPGRRPHVDFELAVLVRDREDLRLAAESLFLEQRGQVRDCSVVEDRQLFFGQFLVGHEEDPGFELRSAVECRSE